MPPRIRPLDRHEIAPALLELPAFKRSNSVQPYNIYRTLAHHPSVLDAWIGFGDALRFEGELPGRDRELLILRTGAHCTCEYEWGQHVPYALANGISGIELAAITQPLDTHPWSRTDGALLRAADELHHTSSVTEETWAILSGRYTDRELIEITMLVGTYHVVCFVLNALGVERDAGLPPFPGARGEI